MDDRNLPATQQRRLRLAAEGDVARSHELNATIILLALISLGAAGASGIVKWFESFSQSIWTRSTVELTDVGELQGAMGQVIVKLATWFGSAAIVCLLISLGLNYLQTRKIFLFRKRQSLFETVGAAFSQFVSFDSVFSFFSGIGKVALILTAVYFSIKPEVQAFFRFSESEPSAWLQQGTQIVFKSCFVAACGMFLFGMLDFGWRKWRYEQRIMMTADEQREELREIQTDPQIAAQRRSIQNQYAISTGPRTHQDPDVDGQSV